MKIVCLADTHGHHREFSVPNGDVLIHAGDLSNTGSAPELIDALNWLAKLPHRHKVVIAGNHDWLFEREPDLASKLIPPGIHYLQDTGCVIEGFRIWGSPVQPRFLDWAFNRDRGAAIARHWSMIPEDTDVLVTHGPAFGKLDLSDGEHCGCEMLRQRLSEIRVRLHIFGHIHPSHGVDMLGPTLLVNAAVCNQGYRPVQPPIIVNLEATSRARVF